MKTNFSFFQLPLENGNFKRSGKRTNNLYLGVSPTLDGRYNSR